MRQRADLIRLILVITVWAAEAGADQIWRFRGFTTADGLAHDIVRDVLEDRDGTIWFATMGGLTHYDPRRCSYRTLLEDPASPRREVMALAQGADSALWVATQGGGVGRLLEGQWTWFTTEDGLPSNEISSLLLDRQGQIWATPTTGGIARYNQGWTSYGARDGISAGEVGRCAELTSGEILCGSYDGPQLQRFDGTRWTQIPVDAQARRHFYVHSLVQSREGDLWLATKGAGVLQGSPRPGGYRWTVHDRSRGLASDRVGAIRQTRDGRIWCATSAGVSIYDGRSWRTLNRHDGLRSNQVFAITQAADRAVWLATLGGGASRYGPSGWRQITEAHGLASNNITGGLLRGRGGAIWVGTDRGISVLDRGSWRTIRAGSVELDHINHQLQADDGSTWVATRGGLRRHLDGVWQDYPPRPDGTGPAHPLVNRLALDRERRIWLATAGGVSSFDGKTWRTFTKEHGLPSLQVNDLLFTSSGQLWAATANGLALLQGGRWIPALNSRPVSRMNRIYSLVQDRGGQLWASGLEDVYTQDGSRWRRYQAGPWLPSGIYSRFTLGTDDGSLWFAVRGLGLRRLRAGRWTSYSTDDGLAADTVRDILSEPGGDFMFATLGGGISRYRPDTRRPETFIGSGGSNARTVVPGSSPQGESLSIPFGGQDVLKHTMTEDLLFSYRLDTGPWSPFARGTSARFSRLSPGSHLFEVRAMDRDYNVDSSPALHRFRVLRSWWAEPWLVSLVSFTLLLALYATFRLVRAIARERRAIHREQRTVNQRRDFVRLASHELRKPLARMAHRAEMMAQPELLQQRDKLSQYASAIVSDSRDLAKMVEMLLEQARVQEGLQLELQEGDLNPLVQRVVAEAAEDGPPLELKLTAEPLVVALDQRVLPLVLRNLVDNALKYGGAREGIRIETRHDGGEARVLVQDLGPGVEPEDRPRIFEPFIRGKSRGSHGGFGLGLSFARDIARAHGGDLMLQPSPKGAIFCLSLPTKGQ